MSDQPFDVTPAPRRIHLPMSAEEARSLRLGETVLIDGEIVASAGLPTYQRIADHLARGEPLPLDLRDGALMHLGSYSRESAAGGLEVLYLNPTTSTRFNALMPGIVRGLNLHAVGGKGGLDAACVQALQDAGCVYLAFPGGACPLLSDALRGVREVGWPEMLVHYRLVRLAVQGLGPATVAIDAHGGSLYADVAARAQRRLAGEPDTTEGDGYAPPHMPALPVRR